MNKLFAYDGPLVTGLNALVNQAWLNILALVCCIPIITAGASLTALHITSGVLRNGDCPVTKTFFRAFRSNFRQSTLLFLVCGGSAAALSAAFFLCLQIGGIVNYILEVVLILEGVFVILLSVWVFPLQARYQNTIRQTLYNAFLLVLGNFPVSVLMLILYLFPYLLVYCFPETFPFVLLFSLSVPVHICARIYSRILQKAEELQKDE